VLVPQETGTDAPAPPELAAILKGGTGALAAKWDTTSGDAFDAFRAASFDELCERGRQRDEDKEVSIKIDLGEQVSEEDMERRRKEAEDAERALLEGKEAVTSRKFEGKLYAASNDEIRKGAPTFRSCFPDGRARLILYSSEWQNLQKREHVSRTVVIGGHSVAKETLVRPLAFERGRRVADLRDMQSNGSWEAVKTLTSDPKVAAQLGDAKRTTRKFEHQDVSSPCSSSFSADACRLTVSSTVLPHMRRWR
jgi:SWI/SNF-related matrix-associated actin-dependent regulator of chromatin subfamily A member 5